MLEVYPHAALVELFDLKKTIKYKRGKAAERRNGLQQLQRSISQFVGSEPGLTSTPTLQNFVQADLNSLSGGSLKSYEDKIDSVVCAYLAYYYWRWGASRNRVFGSIEAGYIVNPSRGVSSFVER
jgi:predicted RNase H-like nuclease